MPASQLDLFTAEHVSHHFGGGVYVKEVHVPRGYVLAQHRHAFEHLSYLALGSVELTVEGAVTVIVAPACLTIPAEKHHTIKALTDSTWLCIHATAEVDPDAVDGALVLPPTEDMRALAESAL